MAFRVSYSINLKILTTSRFSEDRETDPSLGNADRDFN